MTFLESLFAFLAYPVSVALASGVIAIIHHNKEMK